jgi:hypothetical protein
MLCGIRLQGRVLRVGAILSPTAGQPLVVTFPGLQVVGIQGDAEEIRWDEAKL